jgi:hypothetical protein
MIATARATAGRRARLPARTGRAGLAAWSGGQCPGAVAAGQALAEQVAQVLDDLLADPTIKNLYIGDHPTYWIAPGIPHDAYLGEFLMRTKAVIRD